MVDFLIEIVELTDKALTFIERAILKINEVVL